MWLSVKTITVTNRDNVVDRFPGETARLNLLDPTATKAATFASGHLACACFVRRYNLQNLADGRDFAL